MNEVGEVLWHSLDKQGNIAIYDVIWPSGEIETDIPVKMLEGIKENEHSKKEAHGVQSEDTPLNERSYKRDKMKLNRKQLRKLIREGLSYFSSEDKSDVFSAKPDQAKNHAEEWGKAYYIYKSENDGNTYVDLYDRASSNWPKYEETDLTGTQVNNKTDVKKFYQGG